MARQLREVRVKDLITYFLIPLLSIIALWILTPLVVIKYIPIPAFAIYIVAAIGTYFLLKRTAIGAVLAYKSFAPMSVRGRCRFTPTCSTYMIMAIQKYGLIRGAIKGFKRISRCKPPNGGVDYP